MVGEGLTRLLHQVRPRLILIQSEMAIILGIASSHIILIIDISTGLDLLFLHRVSVESISGWRHLLDLLLILLSILIVVSSLAHFKVVIEDHLVSLFFKEVHFAILLLLLVFWLTLPLVISVGVFIQQVVFFNALPHACLVLEVEALLTGLLGLLLEIQIF